MPPPPRTEQQPSSSSSFSFPPAYCLDSGRRGRVRSWKGGGGVAKKYFPVRTTTAYCRESLGNICLARRPPQRRGRKKKCVCVGGDILRPFRPLVFMRNRWSDSPVSFLPVVGETVSPPFPCGGISKQRVTPQEILLFCEKRSTFLSSTFCRSIPISGFAKKPKLL